MVQLPGPEEDTLSNGGSDFLDAEDLPLDKIKPELLQLTPEESAENVVEDGSALSIRSPPVKPFKVKSCLASCIKSKWRCIECSTATFLVILLPPLFWISAFLLVGGTALPGGTVFSLILLEICGLLFGLLFETIKLPPLLGMLTVGILVRNLSYFEPLVIVPPQVSSVLRQIALVVILVRAGLGLDPVALLKLKGVVIRLAFLPCICEAIVIAIATRLILNFPWAWGFLLGFVLAAVSPAVVVPCLLALRDRGYGIEKGIPTVVIAASSVDDILAISCFGVTLGLAISAANQSVMDSILQGPLEIFLGLALGIFSGVLIGVPFTERRKDWTEVTIIRTAALMLLGILSLFGTQYAEYPGAGPLATLTLTLVAASIWRWKKLLDDNDALNQNFSLLWFIFQPMLFSLIGLEIDLQSLDARILGLGLLCVFIALAVRLGVSFLAVSGANLNVREKIFVAISWVPKATVQAAIGPVALDTARKLGAGPEAERLGLEVLTIAVLVILITAPIGATAITLLGPRLLSKTPTPLRQNSNAENP